MYVSTSNRGQIPMSTKLILNEPTYFSLKADQCVWRVKKSEGTKLVIRSGKPIQERQHSDQKEQKDKKKKTMLGKTRNRKLNIQQHERHQKPGTNLGTSEG